MYLSDFMYMLRGIIISITIYSISIAFIKIAIILEWLRIFNPRRTRGVFYWSS
ncbi:hypothetical protein F4810DRAFT_664634, partial [Camillea tinctor]